MAVEVKVFLPSLLLDASGGRREVEIEAETLDGCIEGLIGEYPLIGPHLFDEEGSVRRHVHIFYNEQNTQWLDSWEVTLVPGDSVTILQAVSGG